MTGLLKVRVHAFSAIYKQRTKLNPNLQDNYSDHSYDLSLISIFLGVNKIADIFGSFMLVRFHKFWGENALLHWHMLDKNLMKGKAHVKYFHTSPLRESLLHSTPPMDYRPNFFGVYVLNFSFRGPSGLVLPFYYNVFPYGF